MDILQHIFLSGTIFQLDKCHICQNLLRYKLNKLGDMVYIFCQQYLPNIHLDILSDTCFHVRNIRSYILDRSPKKYKKHIHFYRHNSVRHN
jgi:hypothetical protein